MAGNVPRSAHPYALSHGAAPRLVSKTAQGTLEQLTYEEVTSIHRAFKLLAPKMKPYADFTTSQLDAYIEVLCASLQMLGCIGKWSSTNERLLEKLLRIRANRAPDA